MHRYFFGLFPLFMKLILAPMEGLIDVHMRTLLTRSGGFDHCVTEFMRVVDQLMPERVFYRVCPEAANGWRTPSGTPVHLQLLGSDPNAMAENACRAADLGAPVIDVNFGCPSKTVNNSKGGAVLLKEPETIHQILTTIRRALPSHVPLTAKMRLGFEDKSLAIDNAKAIETAGVQELCVHARTKVEGYRPPAHWEWIGRIRESVSINVVANGDITSPAEYARCRAISGCSDVMIGRSAVAQPDLAFKIKNMQPLRASSETPPEPALTTPNDMSWRDALDLLQNLLVMTKHEGNAKYCPSRIKQWLSFLKSTHKEGEIFFESVKKLKSADDVEQALHLERGRYALNPSHL